MSQPASKETEHTISVRAGAKDLYRLIADVENWPLLFPPTIHVRIEERREDSERMRIWATANGEVKTWTSRRVLDPDGGRITFRQERSQPPVGQMGGTWVIEPSSGSTCLVRLLHDYRAVDDDPEKLRWIDEAVDRNSQTELAALRDNAELATGSAELLATFTDEVRVAGAGKDVFDFINEAGRWPERLPHVSRVDLREDTPGLQVLAMDTRAGDGSEHTTESVRVAFPDDTIVYKQLRMPPLMSLHTGIWRIVPDGDEVVASSTHTVAVNEANVPGVLGEGATVADARAFLRKALGGNSLATLEHAKRYAERAR